MTEWIRWIKKVLREWKWEREHDWAHVPPPQWSAKRGGRDYW